MPSAESAPPTRMPGRQPERGSSTTQMSDVTNPSRKEGNTLNRPPGSCQERKPMSAINGQLAAPESDSKCRVAKESFPTSGNVPPRDSPTWPSTEDFH